MRNTLAFGVLVVVVVLNAELVSGQCKPHCKEGEPSEMVCARKTDSKICRRLKMCELQDLNCGQPRKVWNVVDAKQCGNMRGSGPCMCTNDKKCGKTRCKRDEKKTVKCYRSNNDECRLLTVCQARLENCKRPANNHLQATRQQGCRGMKRGDKPRKCAK